MKWTQHKVNLFANDVEKLIELEQEWYIADILLFDDSNVFHVCMHSDQSDDRLYYDIFTELSGEQYTVAGMIESDESYRERPVTVIAEWEDGNELVIVK